MADPDYGRIKRNISKMISLGAPEADIDAYVASEGVTAEQLRAAPKIAPAAGPWTKYQNAPEALALAEGPWTKYAAAASSQAEAPAPGGSPDTATDIAKSAGAGVVRGVAGLAALPVVLKDAAKSVANAAYRYTVGAGLSRINTGEWSVPSQSPAERAETAGNPG
ncbi:hypothetical protein [Blastochloris sulfoviridis]|uniref:Uncharacterized protein n=1 Tax=Blastochloris sulfoviridis TaxID=50712 RepID=A0A5M6HVP7_9HYPH|nr:hypothetical protein [Blastochloris sulfoviridis]KAA5599941.1 hypothetical protein F1193_11220 [Blastochloris sulfoviridis]